MEEAWRSARGVWKKAIGQKNDEEEDGVAAAVVHDHPLASACGWKGSCSVVDDRVLLR